MSFLRSDQMRETEVHEPNARARLRRRIVACVRIRDQNIRRLEIVMNQSTFVQVQQRLAERAQQSNRRLGRLRSLFINQRS